MGVGPVGLARGMGSVGWSYYFAVHNGPGRVFDGMGWNWSFGPPKTVDVLIYAISLKELPIIANSKRLYR